MFAPRGYCLHMSNWKRNTTPLLSHSAHHSLISTSELSFNIHGILKQLQVVGINVSD